MAVRLRISKAEAVILGKTLHMVDNVSETLVELRALNANSEPLCLSHQDLKTMLDDDKARLEYGYFSNSRAARRALAGSMLVSRMPAAEQARVFRKQLFVEEFEAGEAAKEVSRSQASVCAYMPKLVERVEARLTEQIRQGRNADELAKLFALRAPCRTSLMKWLRDWQETRDPMCFVKRSRFNSQNAKRVSARAEAIMQETFKLYLHPNRVNVPYVTMQVNRAIRELNRSLALNEDLPEPEVSESTVRRRISELNKFEVCAAREGLTVAKNKFGPYTKGLLVEAPLQGVEMDEWQIDLLAFLEGGGIDVSHPSYDKLRTGRFWICVALDRATRVVLAVKMAFKPNSDIALATLWLAMRNKAAISKQLGCQKEWSQGGHIFSVFVDNGSAFVDSKFSVALADLGVGYAVLPAGVPKLRARIERLFRTFGTRLMQRLTGRTFGNPQERGDYPADQNIVHTAESIVELLVSFVVDEYHHTPHRGLEYATPADTWHRLIDQYGHSPIKSPHDLRHILGIPLQRQLGRHGALVCGVNYHSQELAEYFMRYGAQKMDLRLDPEDMGFLSIWYDDAWHTIPAGLSKLQGVSLAVWDATIRDLRRTNKAAARLHIDVVDAALERSNKNDDAQRAWRQIGPLTVSARDIRRAEQECFFGLSFGGEAEAEQITPHSDLPSLSNAISQAASKTPAASAQPAPPDLAPSTDSGPRKPKFNWRFSDDNE
ncbi:hypothetical protein [Thioclava sp. GXIMD4215]|uniref:hypothetical protein n=1 Tax=Thioclava sp. GXIMD4215 TaxID=3131928 RepID=UPI00325434DD